MFELVDVSVERLENILSSVYCYSRHAGIISINSCLNNELRMESYDDNHFVELSFDASKKYLNVYINNPLEKEIKYSLNKLKLENYRLNIGEQLIPVLGLTLEINNNIERLRSFTPLIREFIKLGKDYSFRDKITSNPSAWIEEIAQNIGNKYVNKQPYDLFGELYSLKVLYDNGLKPRWNAGLSIYDSGSNDILCDGGPSFEVKTTKTRYLNEVVIHSQYQLKQMNNDLYLMFIRIEEDINGISINDLLRYFDNNNVSSVGDEKISNIVAERGYDSNQLNNKYNVIEISYYKIDASFPSITLDSFKSNTLPDGISKIEYTVDLSNIKKSTIEEIRGEHYEL